MKVTYLPRHLDLEKLLLENPPAFKYKLDKFKFIIGSIIKLKWQNKNLHYEEYVPLNAQILQSKIYDYKYYLNYLVKYGIIETNNHYIPGEKSKGYKLNNTLRRSDYVITDFDKLSTTTYQERAKEKAFNRKYGFLCKWFNSNLKVDYEAAKECLYDLAKEELRKVKAGFWERKALRDLSIKMLNKGIFYKNVDNTCHRFHSNLTNLKSELRNYITYNDKQLCSVDVKNSQPFISMALFNSDFYSKTGSGLRLHKLSPKIYNSIDITSISSILSTISYIMLVKSNENQCQSDIERFCTLVDKGRLYQYISIEYKKETGVLLDLENSEGKKKLKEAIFVTLFSDNRYIGQPDAQMKRFFKTLFPTVYKLFSIIKKKSASNLPIILQLIESEIIINHIAKRLGKEQPNLPIYTIHDSIVTLTERKEMVRDIIKEEFEQAIGFKPSLSFDIWDGK